MPDSQNSSSNRGRLAVIAIAVLVVLYFGVTSGVRAYVDSRIEKSRGQPMPAFALKDRSGRVWTEKDLLGKTTVLNFFRSRCPNCVQERDAIARLAETVDPAKVQVLGIMTDRVVSGISEELTRKTLARMAYKHPILLADRAFLAAFHGAGWAHVTPVTYIVDAKGRIKQALRGHQEFETLWAAAN